MKAPVAAACLTLAATGIVCWLSPAPPKTRVIRALAFSSEGRFLASGDRNGDIEIRLAASLEVVKRIRLESGGLNALAFSPDGRLLAVAGRSLALWGTTGWNQIAELGTAIYGTVRFSPDGREFGTVNASERIEIWDTGTGKRVQTLCCMALYGDLAFSPDGRMLAAGGHWPSLWDYRAGRRLRRLVETREPTFGPVCFGRGGRVLATGSQDGRARVWDAATGKEGL